MGIFKELTEQVVDECGRDKFAAAHSMIKGIARYFESVKTEPLLVQSGVDNLNEHAEALAACFAVKPQPKGQPPKA